MHPDIISSTSSTTPITPIPATITTIKSTRLNTPANNLGFTLIELIAVIVLLGILAVVALPKFVSLSTDAHRGVVKSTGGSFKTGVSQIHLLWLTKGSPGAVLNFLPLTGTNAGGDLSVNSNGWPADTRGVSLTLNSNDDCLDVWRAILNDSAPSVAASGTADYIAQHSGGSCTYTYQAVNTFSIQYNSNTWDVVTNLL